MSQQTRTSLIVFLSGILVGMGISTVEGDHHWLKKIDEVKAIAEHSQAIARDCQAQLESVLKLEGR